MARAAPHSLVGKLLLATPQMGDPRFERAVIFICAHDKNGAMGLVLNHVIPNFGFKNLLEQLGVETSRDKAIELPVMMGGPVEPARGFLLHGKDYRLKDTVEVNKDFSITATLDCLKSVAEGEGPEEKLFLLGYAGWGEGQLESELKDNAWLVADADEHLVFETDTPQLWNKAIETLGIQASFLTSHSGTA